MRALAVPAASLAPTTPEPATAPPRSPFHPVAHADLVAAVIAAGFLPEEYVLRSRDLVSVAPAHGVHHFLNHGVFEDRVYPTILRAAGFAALAALPIEDQTARLRLLRALIAGSIWKQKVSRPGAFAELWPEASALSRAGLVRPVLVAGDSHTNLYALPHAAPDGGLLLPLHFESIGASAIGLANAESRSGAGDRLAALLTEAAGARGFAGNVPVLLLFGQVDLEFVYTKRRLGSGTQAFDAEDFAGFVGRAIESYASFLATRLPAALRAQTAIVSIHPPSLSDEGWARGYAVGVAGLQASEAELAPVIAAASALEQPDWPTRTAHYAMVNTGLRAVAEAAGVGFLDSFAAFLGPDDVVDPRFIRIGKGMNHHLDLPAGGAVASALAWDRTAAWAEPEGGDPSPVVANDEEAVPRAPGLLLENVDTVAPWLGDDLRGAVLTDIDFSRDGNSEDFATEGFAAPEGGHRWSLGWRSTLDLPLATLDRSSGAAFAVELSCWPCKLGDFVTGQSLTVRAHGRTVFSTYITHGHTMAVTIPDDVIGDDGTLRLEFLHPDFAQPSAFQNNAQDNRKLAVAFRRLRLLRVPAEAGVTARSNHFSRSLSGDALRRAVAGMTGVDVPKLLERFVSMGVSCEFGLVQRQLGCDVMSMHRFGRTLTTDLIAALDSGYAGIADPELIEPYLDGNPKEWMIKHKRYGLFYHTHIWDESRTADDIRQGEVIRLGYYRRKLMEALADDRLVFPRTLHRRDDLDRILPAYHAFRRAGGRWFMAVALADADHPSGAVDWHRSGMLVGYIDRFTNVVDNTMMDVDNWLRVCANALLLVDHCLAVSEDLAALAA